MQAKKPETTKPIFLKPIDDLGFSDNLNSCLKAQNIFFIGDLLLYNEKRLLSVINLDKKSFAKIKAALATYDLHLGIKNIGFPPSIDFLRIENTVQLGRFIQQVRKQLGLKQQDIAFISRTGLRFISDLENGKPTCQIEKIFKVLHNLGIKVNFSGPPME